MFSSSHLISWESKLPTQNPTSHPFLLTEQDIKNQPRKLVASSLGKEEMIKVKVKGDHQNNDEHGYVCFNVEKGIQLRWLMIRYCDELGLEYPSTRFVFNGARLRETDAPLQLGLLDHDVIYAFDNSQGDHGCSSVHYVTVCIRMNKEKDTFVRVRRTVPVLHQLLRCSYDSGANEQDRAQDSLCFVYDGLRLTDSHTADELNMEDGDVINSFNFASSSSLSIVDQRLTIKVVNTTGKERVFIMRQSTSFKWLKDRYREVESLDPRVKLWLIWNGHRLLDTTTVEEEQLKDGDSSSCRS